jgi:hypothetical protein
MDQELRYRHCRCARRPRPHRRSYGALRRRYGLDREPERASLSERPVETGEAATKRRRSGRDNFDLSETYFKRFPAGQRAIETPPPDSNRTKKLIDLTNVRGGRCFWHVRIWAAIGPKCFVTWAREWAFVKGMAARIGLNWRSGR